MNRTQTLVTTLTTLTLLSGAALSAQTNTYPDAIASHTELDMQDIARSVIHSLTPEEQAIIAANDGLGADALDLSGFTRNYDRKSNKTLPMGMTAHEYLDLLMSDDVRNELDEDQLLVVNTIADLMDEGKEVPFFCFAPDASVKYAYLINELLDYQFVSDDGARFQQGNRWTRTAIDGTGLLQGDPTTITYSFVPDGTFVPNSGLGSGNSTLFQWLNGRYGNTATWQALFAQVFDRWAELTGLEYVHELNDDGSNLNGAAGFVGIRGDVRIAAFNYPNDGNGGVLAYNFFPNDGDMALDAFDTFYNNTASNSRRLRNVVSHEHGHGLGMEHVCPASSTKLMEPFISTVYDGPQLDDILNGQRHYGDPLEPNNTPGTATDLGTFATSGFVNITEASIDDNSDSDFYGLTLTSRAMITFGVTPNAGTYLQGGQTQSCNSGSSTNYNSIQNLQIAIYDANSFVTPLMTVNANGTGSGETLSYDAETAGDYVIVVSGATSVNNIQRYIASMIISALPPIVCPADLTGDGLVNFFDVSAFLSAFSAMDSDADFNDDGMFNFFDVSAFLNAFNAGCP